MGRPDYYVLVPGDDAPRQFKGQVWIYCTRQAAQDDLDRWAREAGTDHYECGYILVGSYVGDQNIGEWAKVVPPACRS